MVSALRRPPNEDATSAQVESIPAWGVAFEKRIAELERRIGNERDWPPVDHLPPKAAAALVGYTAQSVLNWARAGKVASQQRGGNWFIDCVSLKAFVASRRRNTRC